nr:hypothetical protein CFP56_33173 [Quercus suber]
MNLVTIISNTTTLGSSLFPLQEQLIAIYTIDKVLLTEELFKAQAKTLALAPALEEAADSPKTSKKKMGF